MDTLFINIEDLRVRGQIGGGVDSDKISQSVAHVQYSQLRPILGEDLMEKITGEIDADNISAEIKDLLDNYIRDFLVNYATADFALMYNYTINNGSVSTYQPSNGNAISTDEVIRLTTRLEDRGKLMGRKLINFLSKNRSLYPEWKGSSTNSNFFGWELGSGGSCNDEGWYL